jgi:hypothetical protein
MSPLTLRNSYYFLVTSLPDLILEEKWAPQGFAAFADDIVDFISEADAELLRYIRLPFDNANLITLLESRQRPFEPNGNYSREDILQGIKTPALLPGYMQRLVEAHKESRQLFPDLSLEDQLNWLFYEEAVQHPNEFLAAWFTFELHLRNVLAGLNVRSGFAHLNDRVEGFERVLASSIVCRDEVSEQILKSLAPEFGLSSRLEWIETFIELPMDDVARRETEIDQLRWDRLDGLSLFAGFHIESMLAFCLKLFIVERWQGLDPQEGKRKLERLVGQMKNMTV